jgi:hypothetical protein
MIDALLRAVLTRVEYETPHPGQPPPDPVLNDVDCNLWSGLLEFAVEENGSYPAAVPFINLSLPYGGIANPDILVYDGVGGYCGPGTPDATLTLRVTVSGLDSMMNPVFGTTAMTASHPGTPTPHPPPTEFAVLVSVDNPVRRRKARLWFYYQVGTMC